MTVCFRIRILLSSAPLLDGFVCFLLGSASPVWVTRPFHNLSFCDSARTEHHTDGFAPVSAPLLLQTGVPALSCGDSGVISGKVCRLSRRRDWHGGEDPPISPQKPPLFRRDVRRAKTGTLLAGAPGFEPGNGGIKIRCLTTWLRPNAVRNAAAAGPLRRAEPSPVCSRNQLFRAVVQTIDVPKGLD